ncbi:3'-5' exonuclease [Thiohalomonas denitrificans]|uniref:DNA polymerase-3 subunit epsilon n=1 Tax=Thiohalomonas denitrificans TaxID=415747 RepID=A0A1G5PHT9_9GAMM|nr:3'-5' exonuclease [Thiohalomonas denitrificans]SCZ49085.1 DNA polymerase-3 subunit epsilon [Thiohalomonas denitrificans]
MRRNFCVTGTRRRFAEVVSMEKSESREALDWAIWFEQQARLCRDPDLQRFYAAGLPGAGTALRDLNFLALDFETTGMNPHWHAIVSIGMVPFTLERIWPARGHYWLVRPPGRMNANSISIHHITHSEVAGAPDLDEVLGEILDAMAGHVPVVHYRNIERPFLDAEVMARRGEHCLFPVIDTMTIEAIRTRQGMMARLRSLLGFPRQSIRLMDSRQRYGLPDYASHHAKVDAMATAELFQAQVARYYSPDTPIGELWL